MDTIPLKSLGLERKWARLAELQDELAGLQLVQQQAEAQASVLHNEFPGASERDLIEAAQALRAGGEPPSEGTHEKAVQERLERARKDAIVYRRAAEQVMSDIGALRARHQAEFSTMSRNSARR